VRHLAAVDWVPLNTPGHAPHPMVKTATMKVGVLRSQPAYQVRVDCLTTAHAVYCHSTMSPWSRMVHPPAEVFGSQPFRINYIKTALCQIRVRIEFSHYTSENA
jgi:hypothetical protein